VIESPYYLGRGEVTDVTFTGATEALTIKLLNCHQPLSRPRLAEASSILDETCEKPMGREFVIKALRTKWEARRIRLAPGDRVSIGLKAHKLLRD